MILSFIYLSDGTIRTRGDNMYGQLGNGNNTNNTTTSETVSGISTATKIVTGQWHACALLSNGQVWCWGVNYLVSWVMEQQRTEMLLFKQVYHQIQQ